MSDTMDDVALPGKTGEWRIGIEFDGDPAAAKALISSALDNLMDNLCRLGDAVISYQHGNPGTGTWGIGLTTEVDTPDGWPR